MLPYQRDLSVPRKLDKGHYGLGQLCGYTCVPHGSFHVIKVKTRPTTTKESNHEIISHKVIVKFTVNVVGLILRGQR